MKTLIDKIIAVEWDMFGKVQNEGGRAECQDNFPVFDIMRRSQFEAWDSETLESYLSDLEEAGVEGRNLLTEKYAYMMEYTAPDEYSRIRDVLPPLSEAKKQVIRRITSKHLSAWDEIAETYPLTASRGRAQYTGEETGAFASIETYLLGELATYSERTLILYEHRIDNLLAEGKKIPRMILENTVKKYGFASLDEAEKRGKL